MSKKNQNGLSSAELSNFCGQVALILEAGLPLYDGMETLAGADKGSENADIYESASRGVTEKGSLYDALREDGAAMKAYQMIRTLSQLIVSISILLGVLIWEFVIPLKLKRKTAR